MELKLLPRAAPPHEDTVDVAEIAVFLCSANSPPPACRDDGGRNTPAKAITAEQRETVRRTLITGPGVEQVTFEDRQAAYRKFREHAVGTDSERFIDIITPEDMPESFRVGMTPGADRAALVETAKRLPGVANVVDPQALAPSG